MYDTTRTRSTFILIAAVFAVFLTGCVTANTTKLSANDYPPLDPNEVTIYLSEDDVPGDYEKVGIINLSGNYQFTNQEKMYEKARKEAAKIGANGVVVEEIREPGTGAKVASALVGVGGDRTGEMLAIFVFSD